MVELFLRFLVVGATAFGGGGTALPLVERITVAETGWLTPQQFAIGVGFAYATPGPILILAAFVGYRVAGIAGALVGTVGVFAIPVILGGRLRGSGGATETARAIPGVWALCRRGGSRVASRYARYPGAAGVELHPSLLVGSLLVSAAERLGVSPVLLLVIAVGAGAAAGAVGWFA